MCCLIVRRRRQNRKVIASLKLARAAPGINNPVYNVSGRVRSDPIVDAGLTAPAYGETVARASAVTSAAAERATVVNPAYEEAAAQTANRSAIVNPVYAVPTDTGDVYLTPGYSSLDASLNATYTGSQLVVNSAYVEGTAQTTNRSAIANPVYAVPTVPTDTNDVYLTPGYSSLNATYADAQPRADTERGGYAVCTSQSVETNTEALALRGPRADTEVDGASPSQQYLEVDGASQRQACLEVDGTGQPHVRDPGVVEAETSSEGLGVLFADEDYEVGSSASQGYLEVDRTGQSPA